MSKLHYINSKLSDAINILTVGEGDARARLALAVPKLKVLSTSSFPIELQKDFKWVMATIERGIGVRIEGFPIQHITRITNKTASKVIKKILFIQDHIDSQIIAEIES